MGTWAMTDLGEDHFDMPDGSRKSKHLRCGCGQPKPYYAACCSQCAAVQKQIVKAATKE